MSITVTDAVEPGGKDPKSRRWQDPDQLICPGCAEQVRPQPPAYWRVRRSAAWLRRAQQWLGEPREVIAIHLDLRRPRWRRVLRGQGVVHRGGPCRCATGRPPRRSREIIKLEVDPWPGSSSPDRLPREPLNGPTGRMVGCVGSISHVGGQACVVLDESPRPGAAGGREHRMSARVILGTALRARPVGDPREPLRLRLEPKAATTGRAVPVVAATAGPWPPSCQAAGGMRSVQQ
jgi:hypothetical protein